MYCVFERGNITSWIDLDVKVTLVLGALKVCCPKGDVMGTVSTLKEAKGKGCTLLAGMSCPPYKCFNIHACAQHIMSFSFLE